MQSPLLSVPLKATSPADVTTPIAELITTSYEQDPGCYAVSYTHLRAHET